MAKSPSSQLSRAPHRVPRKRRHSGLGLAALAVAFVVVPTADAASYCVQDPVCVKGGGKVEATLEQALTDAHATKAADVITVGAGTFHGNFYSGSPASPVEIVGAGQGKTNLVPKESGPPGYPKTLSLQSSPTASASVRDLTIQLSGDAARGLELLGGSTATRVNVEGAGVTNGSAVILEPGTYDSGKVSLPGNGNHAVDMTMSPSVVRNSALVSSMAVFFDSPGSGNVVQRSKLTVTQFGVSALAGDLRVEDTVVDGRAAANGRLLDAYTPNAGAPAIHLTVADSTVVGDPVNVGTVGVRALTVHPGSVSDVHVSNSVLTGFKVSAYRQASDGAANVTFDHTVHGPTDTFNQMGGTGGFTETAPLGDPAALGFVDAAAGDFRLAAGSPLVDAGTPGPLAPGDGLLDFDNLPRLADGNADGVAVRDVGAFERPGPAVLGDAPVDPAAAGSTGDGSTMPGTPPVKGMPGTPPPGYVPPSENPQADRLAPRLVKLAVVSVRVGKAKTRRPALRFSADEAATLGVSIERRVGKRWVLLKGGLTLTGKAGLNTIVLPSKVGRKRIVAGRYRLTVVARDAASNVTAPAVVGFVAR